MILGFALLEHEILSNETCYLLKKYKTTNTSNYKVFPFLRHGVTVVYAGL